MKSKADITKQVNRIMCHPNCTEQRLNRALELSFEYGQRIDVSPEILELRHKYKSFFLPTGELMPDKLKEAQECLNSMWTVKFPREVYAGTNEVGTEVA